MTRFTGFLWLNPAEEAEQFCAPDGASPKIGDRRVVFQEKLGSVAANRVLRVVHPYPSG
jgi:hypothetical protein